MKILLKDLVIDAGTQSREMINQNTVAEYTEAMIEGAVFPEIQVYDDGLKKYLVDGFHRYFGYKRASIEEVEAVVTNGSLREARLYSLGVNDKHGLPRTIADKRKAVMTMLNDIEWQDLSTRDMGVICKVSHMTVQRIRKELSKPKPSSDPSAPKPEVTSYKPLDTQLEELNEELREEIEVLEKPLSSMELEIKSLKMSRDELMTENANLKKELLYWKRKAEKLSKV